MSRLFLCLLWMIGASSVMAQTYQSEDRPGADGLIATYSLTPTFSKGGRTGLGISIAASLLHVDKVTYRGKTYNASELPADVLAKISTGSVERPIAFYDLYNGNTFLKSNRFDGWSGITEPWGKLLGIKGTPGDYKSVMQAEDEAIKQGEALLKAGAFNIKINRIQFVGTYNYTALQAWLTGKEKAATPPPVYTTPNSTPKTNNLVISSKSSTSNTDNTGNTKSSEDDFWGEKKATTTAPVKTSTPEIAMSTDGRYYQKGADGKYQEINQDDYYRIKKEKAAEKMAAANANTAAQQEANQQKLDATMAKIKKDQADDAAMWKDIDRKIDLRNQAFQAGTAKEEAKENVRNLTTLSGNYASVEQLMADFNDRMAQLNGAMNDLTAKRNAQVNASVDASFNGPGDAAYAETFKAVGGLVNSIKEDKEKKRAKAEMEAQKDAMLRNMKAEEVRLLTGMRTDLFSRFKEGSLPLSSTKLEANTIYYFAYAYDPAQVGAKHPSLYVSNVFAVSRYSDGTWPFKTSVTNEIAKLTPYSEVLHGYYTNPNEAVAMRNAMQNVFTQSGGSIINFNYKGKKTSSTTSSGTTDFWETGKKAASDSTSKGGKPVKKDDFWNN